MKKAISVGALLLGLSLASFSSIEGAPPSSRVTLNVYTEFTFELQPGVWHGFFLSEVSENRGYIVEVNPTEPAEADLGGENITSRVQAEFDGQDWNDVLRVQLMDSLVPVNAMIRVYSVSSQ